MTRFRIEYIIPDIDAYPVAFLEAENRQEAFLKLLAVHRNAIVKKIEEVNE